MALSPTPLHSPPLTPEEETAQLPTVGVASTSAAVATQRALPSTPPPTALRQFFAQCPASPRSKLPGRLVFSSSERSRDPIYETDLQLRSPINLTPVPLFAPCETPRRPSRVAVAPWAPARPTARTYNPRAALRKPQFHQPLQCLSSSSASSTPTKALHQPALLKRINKLERIVRELRSELSSRDRAPSNDSPLFKRRRVKAGAQLPVLADPVFL